MKRQSTKSSLTAVEVRPSSLAKKIDDIRARERGADFDTALLLDIRAMEEHLSTLRNSDELYYLKLISISAEVYDYFGCFEDAQRIVSADGSKILYEFPHWAPAPSDTERILRRQQVWVVLHYAQTKYRIHSYNEAEEIVHKCMNVIFDKVRDEKHGFDCFGTLARVNYLLGRIYRQRVGDYEKAKRFFTASIEYSYQALEKRTKGLEGDSDRYKQEQALAAYRIAKSLALGLGWIYYTQGFLRQALPVILTARALLLPTQDRLHKAYVELLYGCVQRSAAGYDQHKLADAKRTLWKAYRVFSCSSHLAYKARAAYQLALVSLYSGKYNRALAFVRRLKAYSVSAADDRWRCNALIIESRILRRKANGAEDVLKRARDIASEAFRGAERGGLVLCQTDALLARGEALLDLKEVKSARGDFSRALEMGGAENPKMYGICRLHLAKTYVADRNLHMAEKHFDEWKRVEKQVENQLAHDCARIVQEQLAELTEDFVISSAAQDLKYENHLKNLQAFLETRAKQKSGGDESVAEILGVSRQTLYNWRNSRNGAAAAQPTAANKPPLKNS
jgi:tetratricopeptide (TPR) repeat protein